MASHRLVGMSGSLRAGSFNTKLMLEAMRLFDPAEFHRADLRFPLYDGDLETSDGVPAAVQALADEIAAADAVVVATPEYNKALSGVLKNALDWLSRTKTSPWKGKPVAILSAAAGRGGGERAQSSLILCLSPFQPRLLLGAEVLIGGAGSAFDEDGRLKDERSISLLQGKMDALHALIDS